MHMRKALEVKTRFYLGQKSFQFKADHDLMHYGGTGEMRRLLEVKTGDRWVVNPRHSRVTEEPDAVFRSPYGDVAIEFDADTYTLGTIRKKLDAFSDRAFIETVWGVTSPTRQRNLREDIGPRLKRDILLTDWWSDQPAP
ncbi:helix-turn-helix domain-containing protein [Deinococcus aquatilis]|uniref:helix-turn-helix domain-containing protein n=1 Tax=Deinococcus aquatilis TaxID=519440 RepID=UPI0003811427|nr:helix-turn-helix domain-containing protein [Deinococcus aquatilis]